MKIAEFGSLQMVRTEQQHFGNSKIKPLTTNVYGNSPVKAVEGLDKNSQAAGIQPAEQGSEKSFQSFLMEAMNNVNASQMRASSMTEKIITNPDDVDIHDVTIAMSQARMSLNLAQTVIDRLVTGWNEISTTR